MSLNAIAGDGYEEITEKPPKNYRKKFGLAANNLNNNNNMR
jgi:hypothetical protein